MMQMTYVPEENEAALRLSALGLCVFAAWRLCCALRSSVFPLSSFLFFNPIPLLSTSLLHNAYCATRLTTTAIPATVRSLNHQLVDVANDAGEEEEEWEDVDDQVLPLSMPLSLSVCPQLTGGC
jgi:hypothetical protein